MAESYLVEKDRAETRHVRALPGFNNCGNLPRILCTIFIALIMTYDRRRKQSLIIIPQTVSPLVCALGMVLPDSLAQIWKKVFVLLRNLFTAISSELPEFPLE